MMYVETPFAPSAIGPYSQAVKAGGFVFISGQLPVNPETSAVESDHIGLQTEQVMLNLKAIAEAAGTSLDKTVMATCYLCAMSDFDEFNAVYSKYITLRPARSCIAADELPRDVLVEVSLILEA